MNRDIAELSDAVLHEGYLLYPYRASALKNLHRYPFGTLYPEPFCRAHEAGDSAVAELECAIVGGPEAQVAVQARFLQLSAAGAVARDVQLPQLRLGPLGEQGFDAEFEFAPLAGEVRIHALELGPHRWKLRVRLRNSTPFEGALEKSRDDALFRAFASAHLLVRSEAAEFVSAIDPPEELRPLVESCRCTGLWPVLVGQPGTRAALLAAPIILYDHPELAPESPGDFFDNTEIDELLTLRVLTLTAEEKRAMSEGDPHARALLERTEASGLSRLGELHGRSWPMRSLRAGARVRLRPKARADIFDLALAGKTATIEVIERDLEGRVHIAVTVDEDPGRDLGAYGHRFFFAPEEVELL